MEIRDETYAVIPVMDIKVEEQYCDELQEHDDIFLQNFKVKIEDVDSDVQDFEDDDVCIKEEEVFYDPVSGINVEIDTKTHEERKKQKEISRLKNVFLSMRILLEEEISSVEGLAKNEQEDIALLTYLVQSLAEPLHLYAKTFESYRKEAIKGDLSTFCEVYREHRKFLMQYNMRKIYIEKTLISAQASAINRNISESAVNEYTSPKRINQKSSIFEADNRAPVIIQIHTHEGESSGNTPEGECTLLEKLSFEADNSAEHEDLMDNSILHIQDVDSKSKVNSIKTLVLPADTSIIHSGSMSGNASKVLKVCPLCQAQIVNLRRHLRSHNLLEDKVKKLSYRARIRRQRPKTNMKQCPFPICEGLPPHPRLDKHFLCFHKISKHDPIYRKHFVLRRPVAKS